jgi:hypothetical protein
MSKAERRWEPVVGKTFRAAGEGPHGLHQGSVVWNLEAAKHRRETLAEFIPRTWVEAFVDGGWKRVGEVFVTQEKILVDPEPKL